MASLSDLEGAKDIIPITPNDSADLPDGMCRALWVGTGGNIKITSAVGKVRIIPNVPDGVRLDVYASRVWATGTTATDICAMY